MPPPPGMPPHLGPLPLPHILPPPHKPFPNNRYMWPHTFRCQTQSGPSARAKRPNVMRQTFRILNDFCYILSRNWAELSFFLRLLWMYTMFKSQSIWYYIRIIFEFGEQVQCIYLICFMNTKLISHCVFNLNENLKSVNYICQIFLAVIIFAETPDLRTVRNYLANLYTVTWLATHREITTHQNSQPQEFISHFFSIFLTFPALAGVIILMGQESGP